MKKKVIFIIGTGHSGSTLLTLILGSHPEIFGVGELSRLHKLVSEPKDSLPSLCGICENKCEFWDGLADWDILRNYFLRTGWLSTLKGNILRYRRSIYEYLFNWAGRPILVDSSKNLTWIRRQLAPSHCLKEITPIIVFLRRDGRAVANSYLRKYPNRTIEYGALQWKRSIEEVCSFYSDFPSGRKMTVSYEILSTEPEKTIEAICNFLEIDYFPQMLGYWEKDHHVISGNLGTRSLIFRYRNLNSTSETTRRNKSIGDLKNLKREYYEDLGLGIKPDLRWQTELSEKQLGVFERVAGELNRKLIMEF